MPNEQQLLLLVVVVSLFIILLVYNSGSILLLYLGLPSTAIFELIEERLWLALDRRSGDEGLGECTGMAQFRNYCLLRRCAEHAMVQPGFL